MEKYTPAYSNTCMFFLMAPAFLGEKNTALGHEHCCVSHVCTRFLPSNCEAANLFGSKPGISQLGSNHQSPSMQQL